MHYVKKVLSLFLASILLFSMVSISSPLVYAASNEAIIYAFFLDEMGVNVAVACAVLANIEAESHFNPRDEVIDSNGKTSYGICQWNGGRFDNLKGFCSERDLEYSDLSAQLHFLKYELEKSEKSAWNKVKNQDNTADGAYQAAYNWAMYFERCDSSYYVGRANNAKNKYWPKYCNVSIKAHYDANGGTGSMADQSIVYGDTNVLHKNTFTNIGYMFIGWTARRNKDNTWYVPNQGWLTEAQISAGGYSKKLYENEAELIFNNSWTGGAEGTVEFTFYAQWRETTIHLNYLPNGATSSDSFYQDIPFGDTVNLMDNPFLRKGYTLSGWYAQRVSDGTWYVPSHGWLTEAQISVGGYSKKLYANQTPLTFNESWTGGAEGTVEFNLYAQWEHTIYQVRFDANGGTWTSVPNGMMRYGSYYIKQLTYQQLFGELPTVTREGYIFQGWYALNVGSKISERSRMPNYNVLVLAKWKKIAVESIAVQSMPDKTEYFADDVLETAGLILLATKNDGTTETVTEGFTFSPLVLSEVGEQTIIVTYEGVSTSFNVTVQPNPSARTPGDANKDSAVDLKDIVNMERYLAGGWDTSIDERNADVNGDNCVDLKDVIILERYLAGGWNVTLR